MANAGYDGYLLWAPQAARRVAPADAVDPAATPVAYNAGPADFPQSEERPQPVSVQPVGQGQEAQPIAGRRDSSLRLRLQVADPAFLAYAIPDLATTPAPANTIRGLPLVTVQTGFAYDATWEPEQFVDCLVNSLDLEFSEGQAVQATAELYAICSVPGVAVAPPVVPDGEVLHWVHTAIAVGDLATDVRATVSRVRVSIRNNLIRQGVRPARYYGNPILGYTEYAISRAPVAIRPGVHNADVTIETRGRSDVSDAVLGGGAVVITCQHPSYAMYPTPRRLVVAVNASLMQSRTVQETPAGSIVTLSAQMLGHGTPAQPTVTITV